MSQPARPNYTAEDMPRAITEIARLRKVLKDLSEAMRLYEAETLRAGNDLAAASWHSLAVSIEKRIYGYPTR